ncbi:MAG: metal ABC transporter substrate-binding protein [Chthoniobacterales bacterium]
MARALVIAVFAVFSGTIVQAAPLRVVTSFYPVYVATLNVADGVEGVEISNLTSPHIGCLHDYQLTAGDARKLADADLLLANGAGMEPFLEKVARQSPGLRVVEVSEGIPLMDGNPHVWVSFEGARRQAANIAEVLAAVSPDRAEAFRANARAYAGKLSALEKTMRDALAPYAGTPNVTFHEAFPYFARDFRLEIAGVIESEPGTEPSARELADTIKLVRARGVKALFGEPQFSDRSAQVIARETGARVYQLDPVVTGPSAPDEARDAYLRAMKSNLAVLQEALR